MYDIKIRNSVLNLFNGIEADKFPDENFNLVRSEAGYDYIVERDLTGNGLVCDLFDIVEKQLNLDSNRIERIIFKCSKIKDIEILSLKSLVNKLFQYLGKDECGCGEFTQEDEMQFKQGNWMKGRVWTSTLVNGISLTIFRNSNIFELHLTFLH